MGTLSSSPCQLGLGGWLSHLRLSHYTRTWYPLLEHCLPWTLLILTLIYKSTLGQWSSRSLATSIHSQALGLRGLISQLETEGGDAVPSSGTVIKARTCNWALIDRSSSIHLINLVLVVHCDQYMQKSNTASLRRCLDQGSHPLGDSLTLVLRQ